MQLKLTQIHDPQWAQKGYDLPKFDVQRVRAAAPRWVHFGAGNIFTGAGTFSEAISSLLMKTVGRRREVMKYS